MISQLVNVDGIVKVIYLDPHSIQVVACQERMVDLLEDDNGPDDCTIPPEEVLNVWGVDELLRALEPADCYDEATLGEDISLIAP